LGWGRVLLWFMKILAANMNKRRKNDADIPTFIFKFFKQ
jgi:hypothetical protein